MLKKWTGIAAAALIALPTVASAESIFQDWQDNADADLSTVNLQRALLVEKLEEGFFQEPPQTTINGDVINDTDFNTSNSTSIGNLKSTSITITRNCNDKGDEACEVTVDSQLDGTQTNDRSSQQAQSGRQQEGQSLQLNDQGSNVIDR